MSIRICFTALKSLRFAYRIRIHWRTFGSQNTKQFEAPARKDPRTPPNSVRSRPSERNGLAKSGRTRGAGNTQQSQSTRRCGRVETPPTNSADVPPSTRRRSGSRRFRRGGSFDGGGRGRRLGTRRARRGRTPSRCSRKQTPGTRRRVENLKGGGARLR